MSSGRDVGHGTRHLLEVRLGQLLAQLVEQLLEALTSLGRGEVVLLQVADLPARSGESMSSCRLRSATTWSVISWRRWSPDSRASSGQLVEATALELDDLTERLGDVLVDPAQVVAVELLAATLPQAVEEVAEPEHLLAVAIAEALLHETAQRGVDVAVVEQVVGDLLQDGVGIEIEPDLGAVPTRVAEPRLHSTPSKRRRVAPSGSSSTWQVESRSITARLSRS